MSAAVLAQGWEDVQLAGDWPETGGVAMVASGMHNWGAFPLAASRKRGGSCVCLHRHCKALGLPAPWREFCTRLDSLPMLTPGDLATVVRQNRFRPLSCALKLLEAECTLKAGGRPKVPGFV